MLEAPTAAGRHASGYPMDREQPVLVVEDDEVIRTFVLATLGAEGYPVVGTANGAAALECVRQCTPSVIVLDLNMPIMDGRAFLAAYRALPEPHAPVILCTASYRCEEVATQLATDGCLPKPFDLEDLLAAVGQFASSARPAS
ncbi:MAG TPA: response regulator [Chloroflexota bacterium]|nr:response regulator [Chloroflexota bacterium]